MADLKVRTSVTSAGRSWQVLGIQALLPGVRTGASPLRMEPEPTGGALTQ